MFRNHSYVQDLVQQLQQDLTLVYLQNSNLGKDPQQNLDPYHVPDLTHLQNHNQGPGLDLLQSHIQVQDPDLQLKSSRGYVQNRDQNLVLQLNQELNQGLSQRLDQDLVHIFSRNLLLGQDLDLPLVQDLDRVHMQAQNLGQGQLRQLSPGAGQDRDLIHMLNHIRVPKPNLGLVHPLGTGQDQNLDQDRHHRYDLGRGLVPYQGINLGRDLNPDQSQKVNGQFQEIQVVLAVDQRVNPLHEGSRRQLIEDSVMKVCVFNNY